MKDESCNFAAGATEMKAALGKVLSAMSKKSLSNPIWDHVLIESLPKSGQFSEIQFTATDGIVFVRSILRVDAVFSCGRAAVKGKMLFDLLGQESPSTLVKVQGLNDGAGVMITVGNKVNAVIRGQSAMDFPELEPMNPTVKLSLPRGTLRACLSRVRFAASREEESAQNLNCVSLCVDRGRLTATATDGRLFSCLTLSSQEMHPLDFEGTFILPLRAVDEICRLVGGGTRATSKRALEALAMADREAVHLALQDERITASSEDGSSVACQLASGNYPDVLPLLEQEAEVVLEVSKAEMVSHLKKLTLFSGKDKTGSGIVHMALSEGTLTLEAGSSGSGNYTGCVDVDYSGRSLDISFNPVLLLDIMQNLQNEDVRFGISQSGGSGFAVFREENATFLLGAMWDGNSEA